MTKAEWLTIEPGDILINVKSGLERTVLEVKRILKPNQQGRMRTVVTVTHTRRPGTMTICNYDDTRGERFSLRKAK